MFMKNIWRIFQPCPYLSLPSLSVCHIHGSCTLFLPDNVANKSSLQSQPYFVTTPIFYVNAAPHIGHLYTSLLADASARWQRVNGRTTLFSTGTDEHGLKIQQAAALHNIQPQVFCDSVAQQFQATFDSCAIQYDQFIRTTDSAHAQAVQAFWQRLVDNGHIYQGTYSGWYSVSDEAFLSETDVEDKTLPDGSSAKVSKESGHVVTWTEEKNYVFRMSNFQQDLLHWLSSKPIHPPHFEQIVRQMIQNLPDLSVTRDRERLSWGLPVPGDDTQTIYVWLDALINYLTVTGYPSKNWHPWPPDCQLIGKDILRFHAVYWPAFLIAADMAPPPKLVVHSHWLVDNVKMSKSLGNVIDPKEKVSSFGVDGLRYFLLKEGSLESDGTYTDKRVAERINTDLANTLGNLLGRCTAPAVNKRQEFPALVEDGLFEFLTGEEREQYKRLYNLPGLVDQLYQGFHFSKALEVIMTCLHWANSFVQSHAPWELSKSVDQLDAIHLQVVLHIAMETLRVCGILLQPVIPHLSERLLNRLGVPVEDRYYHHAHCPAIQGYPTLGDKIVLQKKVDIS